LVKVCNAFSLAQFMDGDASKPNEMPKPGYVNTWWPRADILKIARLGDSSSLTFS
jgi:hypothetical protein